MGFGPSFNDSFDASLKKKYDILQQNADAESTKANAAAQNVAQQQTLQQQSDAAAQARAQLNADSQLQSTSMNNQSSLNIAGLNNQGANYRTGLTTDTQSGIAGMEDLTKRAQLAQQNQQFGQTMGLDTAKAQEAAIEARAKLGAPEFGAPSFNMKTGAMESAIKRPALTGLAPSPLSSLGGGSDLSMESDDTLRKLREQLSQ